jgi:hypothetical protein
MEKNAASIPVKTNSMQSACIAQGATKQTAQKKAEYIKIQKLIPA